MGICITISKLAEAVSDQMEISNPRQKLQIEILKLMPLYHEIHDLSLWEDAYGSAVDEMKEEGKVESLLEEIYDFGRHNLYCAFNAESTQKCYKELCQLFDEHGVVNPIDIPEIAEW